MNSQPRSILQRPRYECPCGSVISSAPYAKKRHFTTLKHQRWQRETPTPAPPKPDEKEEKQAPQSHIDECPICYEEHVTEVVGCMTCKNELCFTCYDELISKKCPYCRASMRETLSFRKERGKWFPLEKEAKPRRPRRMYPKAYPRPQRNRGTPQRYSPSGRDSSPVEPLPTRVRRPEPVEEKTPEDFIRAMSGMIHVSPTRFIEELEKLKNDRRAFLRIMDRVFSDSVTLTLLNQ